MQEAWADVMRTKAQGKYNKTESTIISPTVVPTPVPSKSKEFAYTNIRLSTSLSGSLMPLSPPHPSPPPPPPAPPTLLEAVAVPGAPAPVNPFITQTVVPAPGAAAVAAAPLVTQEVTTAAETSALQAKLAELQAQIEELKALKEGTAHPEPTGTTARRLLDTGLPGWDPGALLEKVLSKGTEILQL